MSNNKIYCIIVTYNGSEWIEKCLRSVYQSNYHIAPIVIDNNSNDETLKIIENLFPECILIKSNENLGFGKANNLGIEFALKNEAEYVFLLNQDAWITSDTIERLLEVAYTNDSFGIISPIHLNGKGDAFDIRFSTYIAPTIENQNNRLFSDLYLNSVKQYYEANFVNAAAWLISKKCIDKVGLFDSLFFHYGEDVNYCHRVKYHNFKIVVCPKAIIHHDRDDRELKYDLSQEFYKRRILIEFSNPSTDEFTHLHKEKDLLRHFNRSMIKNLIKCQFKKAKENRSFIYFLKDSFEKTKKSRIRNRI